MQSYVAGDGDGDGEVSFSIRDLMLRRLTVTGATRRHRRTESKGQILAKLQRHVWPLIESGRVNAVVDKVFPPREVESAHRHLAAG